MQKTDDNKDWPFYTTPEETLEILALSECHVKCPHCGKIIIWAGYETPPIRCYGGCNRYFIERSKK